MKKLINEPENVVRESLEGLALAHSNLVRVCTDPHYVVRAVAPVPGKVALVSGGGSGHEPLHTGYVGVGMLDAACPGEMFTSPTPDQIELATKAVDGGAGVLHIVKNYAGDVMNFEMAAELCQMDGIQIESVIMNDDVAVEDSLYTAGRRGVGVTVLAEKVCGAAAERGYDLGRVAALCREVNAQGRSMGMALTSCTVPAVGKPTFDLSDEEMEMGVGIHGEPGRKRVPLGTAREIAETMVGAVAGDLPFHPGDQVIAMINGMGGTPLIELFLIHNEVAQICQRMGLSIVRQLVGNYITSLDMAGCSITFLRADEEMVSLWDDPVHTPTLRWGM